MSESAGPDVFPAASGQERMWFLARLEPDLAVYNVNLWMPMRPDCDTARVRETLRWLARRHETLRTSFDFVDGAVVQQVHPAPRVELAETDLRGEPDPVERFRQLARADAARPFALDELPLWRAHVVWVADDDVRLIWICDHTVFDGTSADIFVAEFFAHYDAGDGDPGLPELPIQFADFAVWQRDRLTGERVAAELGHWRSVLDGLPAELGLPTDRPRPAVRSYRGEVHQFTLPATLSERVDAWSRRNGVTPFMTLMTAFKAVLSRWAGSPDVFVGCPMAGRPLPELEPLLGMFVNAVVVRTDLGGDPDFAGAVRRVRASLLESIEHQELPFERIVEDLRPVRDLSRPPLYQVAFNLVPGETRGQIANGTVKVDLALDLNVRDGRLHGRLEYATDLFDEATVRRLARVFQTVLDAALSDATTPLSRLPLLPEGERKAALAAAKGPQRPLPDTTVGELFERQVGRTPDAVAVVSGRITLTYAELHAQAQDWARRLRAAGVGPETVVACCAERSPELVAGLLGTLLAGGVLAPIDPETPAERVDFQLRDSGARVRLDELPAEALPVAGEAQAAGADNTAYLLYTSGSTGWPKGVPISHRALVNRLLWMQERFGIDTGDAVLHKTSAGFDVSVWELFWPLITGARLVLARPGGQRDPEYLRDEIVRGAVTTVHFVPSMLEVFLAVEDLSRCASLRRVVCSGEELTRAQVERLRTLLPHVELHNLYGPTEAAIDVSAWSCPDDERGRVSIGHPVANTQLYVLDEWLEPVPAGFPGELCIGGVQLARGYHGRPELTAAAFVPDPFGPPGALLYRTGDRARVRPDGAIEYLGRLDDQVKVHGVRVELGEIESVLSEHPRVRRAVAAVRDDAPGGRGLVAYVDGDASPRELREHLARRVPQTLLPQAFVPTTDFPTLPSGKTDRAGLPCPEAAEPGARYEAPSTPLEAELCELWAGLLGRDRIGVTDDFFELGGHSLLAVRLSGRLRERFGVRIPLRRFFEVTTVAEHATEILAERLSAQGDGVLAALEGQ